MTKEKKPKTKKTWKEAKRDLNKHQHKISKIIRRKQRKNPLAIDE